MEEYTVQTLFLLCSLEFEHSIINRAGLWPNWAGCCCSEGFICF